MREKESERIVHWGRRCYGALCSRIVRGHALLPYPVRASSPPAAREASSLHGIGVLNLRDLHYPNHPLSVLSGLGADRSFRWPDSEKNPRFFSQTCCGTSHGRVHPSCACALRLCCSAHCAQQHNLGPLQKFEHGEKWQVPQLTPPLRTHLRPDCTAGR